MNDKHGNTTTGSLRKTALLFTAWLLFFFLTANSSIAQQPDVLHYRFFIDLNDDNDTIYGRAEVKLVNPGGGPLHLDLVQAGARGKGMTVTHVEKEGSRGPYPFSQQNNKLVLPVLAGMPGDTVLFYIAYKGVPADGLIISKNKFGDRTFFADNWPNRAHHWLPCNDRPDDKASVEFVVSAPAYYKVISNGIKTGEKNSGNHTLTQWREDTPLSTKIMVIGVARFAVKTYANSSNPFPISAWVYPQDSSKGFYDFALAPEIVHFFSRYIAPFPFAKLANVQSTTIFGGMENASCIFYSENAVTGERKSEALLAHEIAHQWFGDMASEKSFAHIWLSEGFATYLTHLYLEKKYGTGSLQQRLQSDREDIIRFAQTSALAVVDSTPNLMSLLNANSYQKGGWVLHMLRHEVGDTAFQQIIQTYYRQYKGGNAETSDFRRVAEAVSGKNLETFFSQWLYQPGVPSIEVVWMPGQRKIRLRQKQEHLFRFPLEVSIAQKNGERVVKKLWVQHKQQEFTIDVAPSHLPLMIDPDTKLLFAGRAVTAVEGLR